MIIIYIYKPHILNKLFVLIKMMQYNQFFSSYELSTCVITEAKLKA
jgi:hypothetical protein